MIKKSLVTTRFLLKTSVSLWFCGGDNLRTIDADLFKSNIKAWAENIRDIRSDNKCFFTEENILKAIDDQPTVNDVQEWHILTDDEESYPECFEYVLVEDDIGDKNVACCYPDYDWYISNGENSLKLIGEIIKWRRL